MNEVGVCRSAGIYVYKVSDQIWVCDKLFSIQELSN